MSGKDELREGQIELFEAFEAMEEKAEKWIVKNYVGRLIDLKNTWRSFLNVARMTGS